MDVFQIFFWFRKSSYVIFSDPVGFLYIEPAYAQFMIVQLVKLSKINQRSSFLEK